VLGRFHELSVATPDIRASVEFYERLGFRQAQTRDVWSHPYGVLTDGRFVIGLHQNAARDASLTFVQQDVASRATELEGLGLELIYRRTGAESFHEIGLADPDGNRIALLEARTYSPPSEAPVSPSLCGYFVELSMPARDLEAAQRLWEPLGFVATGLLGEPFPRLTLTSDHLSIAFHAPRTLASIGAVFCDPQMQARITHLQDLGLVSKRKLPAGLDPAHNALIEAPEGTLLLLLAEEI
jgi:catechol 2,3-dioxygenase-like lactoylglutathione lyase family enzyme